ncbi:hypothetical protein SAMN05428939_7822 [Streptomyces sp. TLI_105]|nr:hypothetical protein SAMN05428939_7822 [Streptomyces sp. TLI_105]
MQLCGGSPPAARKLWTKAARAEVTVHEVEVRRRKAPAVAHISEPAELLLAMRELRLSAGPRSAPWRKGRLYPQAAVASSPAPP